MFSAWNSSLLISVWPFRNNFAEASKIPEEELKPRKGN